MKFLLPLAALLAVIVPLQARELVGMPYAASNYQLYPAHSLPDVSGAPKGYENFHIEHYGRHGSRWLIGYHRHDSAIAMLERADTLAGGLNDNGRRVLAEIKQARKDIENRQGELSDKGAMQHRGIAARMARNFPGVFHRGTYVDARSTVVPRCMLSMTNAMTQLAADVPGLVITRMDASEADAYYMKNKEDKPAIKAEAKAMKTHLVDFRNNNRSDGAYLAAIFNDPSAAAPLIDVDALAENIYEIAANSVSTGEQSALIDIFPAAELDRLWRIQNAKWFLRSGNTPLTKGLVPMRQRNLLANIIHSADTAMVSANTSANLRFGHDTIVLPLVALMELDDYGKTYTSLDDLAGNWNSYEILPMGCNVQMVFARPEGDGARSADDVLVKVLLNERPVRLPVAAVDGDYVRWSDLRAYYAGKIGLK